MAVAAETVPVFRRKFFQFAMPIVKDPPFSLSIRLFMSEE